MLTQDRLKELLNYDPLTGIFSWRVSPNGYVPAGAEAGSVANNGYVRIGWGKKYIVAHRAAWLMFYGELPPERIDHINRNKSDNRISNLRLLSHAENLQNAKLRRDNTSGVKGVHSERGRWRASISVDNKTINLGSFRTLDDAAAARAAAELVYHPFRAE